MLNDVALFDRIYIRALIFLQLQLLRESFQTIIEAGVWRILSNKNRVDEEEKFNTKKNPNTVFSSLLFLSVSSAIVFFGGC